MDGLSASPGNFRAELWVAKDGEYPVSGFFGFDVPGQGSYGYRFDITHVNDPANIITAPTDIVPTPAPTRTPIPDATGVSNVVAWGDDIWGQTDVPHGLSDAVTVAVGGNTRWPSDATERSWPGVSTWKARRTFRPVFPVWSR